MQYTVINIIFKNDELDFTKVSPIVIHQFLDSISKSWNWIHTNIDKKVLIFKEWNRANVQKFLNIKIINFDENKIEVKFEENHSLNQCDGVIFCRQLICMTDDHILHKLKNQNVLKLYRFKKNSENGGQYDTGLFFLTFNGNYKPDYVSINEFKLHVTSSFHNYKDSQCKHCYMVGHKATRCYKRSITLCIKCNKNLIGHQIVNCKIQCINCGGDHLSSSEDCSFVRNLLKIQSINVRLLQQQGHIESQSLDVETLYNKVNEINTKIRKYEKFCIIYGASNKIK